ncbi:[protein release factor]-glutamine N5-methyltransferase [Albidovulum inexpectatum]|uniref:Release factor glutamine methyltransferase n=1 Tax=Albidovulum inexpectatum TaxID=196587 RepID=A0A2S5JJK2_9RHOB|nr:peptide chain release factor N(5)-glutamine methyltransferase [Albidovulum inexpectatum]PPB81623.1 [protein release factor]-glutamine N5-methyltransferase [Albidovulum inexpectatum]
MAERASRLLAEAVRALRAAGIDTPERDARRLLAHAAGVAPDRVTLLLSEDLVDDQADAFRGLVARRAAREPVSQILGRREFFGLSFCVTRDTLDPRPETELLVEAALARPFQRVLDLGTGTGCILLSCLFHRPAAQGVGVDVSPAALQVARKNAAALGLSDRAEFVQSDWLTNVQGRFDLVVSNPPYISLDEMARLSPEVREWEPHLALTPGGDGLEAYRAIAAGIGRVLAPGGRVLLEIGPTQAADVCRILADADLHGIEVLRDLDGRDRVVCAQS